MIDIVFPKDNEQQFIDMAKQLGYKGICFVYENKIPKVSIDSKGLSVSFGNIGASKKAGSSLVLCHASALDTKQMRDVDVVFDLEFHGDKDFMHQYNSQFNQVMAKEFVLRKVAVGFDFGSLLSLPSEKQSFIMSRMMQNIVLCEKYHVKTAIASFASSPWQMRRPQDVISLFAVLGMNERRAKESMGLL